MRIDDFHFGKISVDGTPYTRDLIVLPSRIIPNWWRKEGHSLLPEDITEIIAEHPGLLIVGRGTSGCMQIAPQTEEVCQKHALTLIAETTPAAVKIFNRKSAAGLSVAGAFHLTC